MNKKIVSVLIFAILSIMALTSCSGKEEVNEKESEKVQAVENVEKENAHNEEKNIIEEKVYKPTFMYFVTNKDYEDTKKIIEKLENEYKQKVVFEIKNIDKEPEIKNNFPVEGKTPALIMLNTNNDISAFEFKCSDYKKLKSCIDIALN